MTTGKRQPFSESCPVILDGAGHGVARLSPRPHSVWFVRSVNVYCATPLGDSSLIPTATLYIGDAAPSNRLDATSNGANDTTDIAFTLQQGQQVTVEWAGGDPGATAIMTVYGEKVIR